MEAISNTFAALTVTLFAVPANATAPVKPLTELTFVEVVSCVQLVAVEGQDAGTEFKIHVVLSVVLITTAPVDKPVSAYIAAVLVTTLVEVV